MVFRAHQRQRAAQQQGFSTQRQPASSFVARRLDSSYFGSARPAGRSRAPAERPIVPGPLGTWERQFRERPYQQTGKFGTSLLGSQGPGEPAQATPYSTQFSNPIPRGSAADTLRAWADPANPENQGFFEGLLGGLFGMTGNEAVRGFGRFLGSGVDLPFETVGNLAGLPGAGATSAVQWLGPNGIDDDIMAMYRAAEQENPLNGILMYSHAAKAQWQRDVEAGRMNGLMQDVGPAVSLTDQLGFLLNMTFGQVTRLTQRGGAALLGTTDESIQAVERASARGERVINPAFQRLQDRLERGDFGVPGTQQARDAMLDSLIAEGSLLRDVDDPEQTPGLFGMTGQGLADVAFSLVTDPTIIASFGVGALAKGAQAGRMAANAKFWQAIPDEALRTQAADAVEQIAMRRLGVSSPEAAWSALGRTRETAGAVTRRAQNVEREILREVADLPAFAAHRDEMLGAVNYLERWYTTWEPLLRPVTSTVRNINDPLRLFGKGPAGELGNTILSSYSSEAVIRGAGSLDAHAHVSEVLADLPEPVMLAYTRGLGVGTANEARAFIRNGIVTDARRIRAVPYSESPEAVIQQRMAGSRGTDIATGLEKLALRYRPLYLALKRGGREEAIERGRAEVARRLELMGSTQDQALAAVAKMGPDELSLMDLAYFGHTTDEFVNLRQAAVAAYKPTDVLNPEELTILGPRQLTMQRADDVLAAVKRGDVEAVREAVRTYDSLFENMSEGMSDVDVLKRARELVEQLVEHNSLPRDLDSLKPMTLGLQEWAERNADLGYRPGLRPTDDQAWRVLVGSEGEMIGVNPWVELVGTAADVRAYNKWQRAKDYLFHNVRGERIMADARVRMALYTSERFGFTRAQSDAMFARVIRLAQEAGITPRGLNPEQVFGLFRTAKLTDEQIGGIGVREAIEAVMSAFQGNLRHVGVTQEFTGGLKTATGGQGNWIGQVAEKIYPLVRFTLNPLFQMQELTEPFILNVMRGIKPGFRATETDERTLDLIENLIRNGKYAMDDQIEQGTVLLWGADSAKQAFGAQTRLGRLTSKLGFLNVKEVKRVNFARATRRQLGKEFEESMDRVMPSLIPRLKAAYGTDDVAEVALRYLSEKSVWATGGRAAQEARIAALKPGDLGARSVVKTDDLVTFFDDINDAGALRAAVADGTISPEEFHTTLLEAGADPEYASRAWVVSRAPLTPDEWWDEFRATVPAMPAVAMANARRMAQAFADTLGVSEEEFLARVMAKPMPLGKARLRPTKDYSAFQGATTQNTRAWNLSAHTPEEFARNKVFLSPDSDLGFMVTPEGDLQNVFNNSPVRGAGREAVELAIQQGARTLDAYDGHLPGYYGQFGFRETGRMKFVDEYAPEGWDFETQGRPDVVFMALTDDGLPYAKTTTYFDDWDAAKAASLDQSVVHRGAGKYRPWVAPEGDFPKTGNPPEDWTDEAKYAYYDEKHQVQREWNAQMARGVSIGRITAADAEARGWSGPLGRQTVEELPENLYHATAQRDSVLANGLKTRDEIGLTGLGGGPEDTISFTTDEALANRIAEVMTETSDLFNGRLSAEDLLARAKAGGWEVEGKKLMMGQFGGSHASGSADTLWDRIVVRRMKRETTAIHKSLDELPEGAVPEGPPLVGGDGVERWNSWERPMTDAEWDEALFDIYRHFLTAQEYRGGGPGTFGKGPADPLFFMPDVASLKRIDPKQVGVVKARPKTGAQGYQVGSMSEWRTWSGDAVDLDDAVAGTARLQTLLGDSARLERALQSTDPNAGLRILADVFEQHLDPSARDVILGAFREASGSKRVTWSRDVSDWWVDQFTNYAKGGKTANRALRSSFEYFRKTVNGIEATIKARADRKAMEHAREVALRKATKQVARAKVPLREATTAKNAADRVLAAAKRDLQRARRRSNADVLEGRWKIAREKVIEQENVIRAAKQAVRDARVEVRNARARAGVAAGTPSAGGLTAAIGRKEQQVRIAERALAQAQKTLPKLRKESNRASAAARGARRRTQVGEFEARVQKADAVVQKADRVFQKADSVFRKASTALSDAKALPVRPKKGGLPTPAAVSPEMRAVLDDILNPPDRSVTKTGPGSPVDIGTPYNLQEEAAYQAAHHALSRAEENAFTLHYYKRGRSFVERSINHPYFGLYPASYMWGKVLPEMLRFLVKTPFGLDAPLGGLALSNNIYRQVMVQQNYDEEFRREMVEKQEFFHLLALLTPALPWEVPVNAPLWTRRVAEADEVHQAKLASGDIDAPLMNVETFGELTREMMNYAFGPAAAATQVTGGIGAAFGATETALGGAAQQIEAVLNQGAAQPLPTPPADEASLGQPTIQLPQIGGTP